MRVRPTHGRIRPLLIAAWGVWASVQLSNGQDCPPMPADRDRADLALAPGTPPALADIMRGCWCPDPQRRLRSSQILHALRVALIDTVRQRRERQQQ